MTEKRSFPSKWSDLSDKQVIENVNYLSTHYKDYVIRRVDKNTISIEDVWLTKSKFDKKDVFRVNGKFYQRSNYPHSGIYEDLNELFDDCEREIEKREILQKLEKKQTRKRNREIWWHNSGVPMIFCALAVVGLGCGVFFGIKQTKKQERIDKKVEQYEKTLPGYQEYQQKIANYRDSLEHESK